MQCIRTFFAKKFRFDADAAPVWDDVKREGKLDFVCEASGYGGKLEKEMEMFHREVSVVTDNHRNRVAGHEGEDDRNEDGDPEEEEEQEGEEEEDDDGDDEEDEDEEEENQG